ncbi:PLD-like domain [Popillia japonica]|uniref:Mitochondrial cardiolipin hydrolase n=1 Tax=Popillia japonica TaxID=7064 RepID=A0AAW1KGJ9_POPJA
MLKKSVIKELLKNGADVCIYARKNISSSIFHLKYAIKDYNTGFSAMCCGSLNWTNAAFLNNYENILFTTNEKIIDEYHRNYESSFSYVKTCMENDLFLPILDLLS